MAYPLDGNPVIARILETIRTNVEAIAMPNYHHDVNKAFVYEGRQLVIGTQNLAAIVVPQDDTISGHLSCNRTEHLTTIAVIGAIRLMPGSEDWKIQAQWFNADVIRAISQDQQLGGDAVYWEPTSQDVFDAGQEDVAIAQVVTRVNYRHVFDNPSLTA